AEDLFSENLSNFRIATRLDAIELGVPILRRFCPFTLEAVIDRFTEVLSALNRIRFFARFLAKELLQVFVKSRKNVLLLEQTAHRHRHFGLQPRRTIVAGVKRDEAVTACVSS